MGVTLHRYPTAQYCRLLIKQSACFIQVELLKMR